MKRENVRDDVDRISDLPDSILLHIMQFMDIKSAVQTCLLSTRWKDLWKTLTIPTFDSNHFGSTFPKLLLFNKFVSSVLSCRDDSISLHNLDLRRQGCIEPRLLNRVMTYAASHDVQQLLINVNLSYRKDFELPSSVFYCRSLTFLKLLFCFPDKKIKLPKSLELSALKSLHMKNVTFGTSDNACAEPFSTCHMLNTLVIEDCGLESDAKDLCISNSKLFSLTISNRRWSNNYGIMLSTPNLNLVTIEEVNLPLHRLSSTCNFTCLEEVSLHFVCYRDILIKGLVLIKWLQVLVNAKIMTLSWRTFQLLDALLSHGSIRTQLPCFVRLKSLKLHSDIPDRKVSRMVKYLLQNSPLTEVDIIKC